MPFEITGLIVGLIFIFIVLIVFSKNLSLIVKQQRL